MYFLPTYCLFNRTPLVHFIVANYPPENPNFLLSKIIPTNYELGNRWCWTKKIKRFVVQLKINWTLWKEKKKQFLFERKNKRTNSKCDDDLRSRSFLLSSSLLLLQQIRRRQPKTEKLSSLFLFISRNLNLNIYFLFIIG